MSDIEKIIHDFGEIQEEISRRIPTHYPSMQFPSSLLPHRKDEIVAAFERALEIKRDHPETIHLLKKGLAFLNQFTDDQEAYNSNHRLLGQVGYWDALRRKQII